MVNSFNIKINYFNSVVITDKDEFWNTEQGKKYCEADLKKRENMSRERDSFSQVFF